MDTSTTNGTDSGGEGPRKKVSTVQCLLCGGTQIYPGPRYENHLINEHGVTEDIEFLIRASVFKNEHGKFPTWSEKGEEASPAAEKDDSAAEATVAKETVSTGIQTEVEKNGDTPCKTCQDKKKKFSSPSVKEEPKDFEEGNLVISNVSSIDDDDIEDDVDEDMLDDMHEDGFDEDMDGGEAAAHKHFMDPTSNGSGENLMDCYLCPMCPKVYKRHSYFKQHACTAHEMDQEDIAGITAVKMSEEEFLRQQDAADQLTNSPSGKVTVKQEVSPGSFMIDKTKRKPIGKDWAPNSFSSTFTCIFCNEQFRKDYKLKLHLMLNHKGEDPDAMSKAKEELTKSKLDGCIHKCAMCGNKYNSVANFTRHIKDVHQYTRAQYKEDYGSSEVVSRMFKCELCEKEVKHTRNIIGAHMKMVHLISWKEYQEILIKLRQGQTVGDLPTPELFDCIICGVSVKYKREHLNKKHQISEDVYDELIVKKERGEDISDVLPEREIYRCLICDRECLDIKKHIERSHQLTEEQYEEMVATKAEGTKRIVKQLTMDESPTGIAFPGIVRRPDNGNHTKKKTFKIGAKDSSPAPSGGIPGMSSTDLACYFGCDEYFKKDYQLYLHLRLKHRNEPPDELQKAFSAADEEIALTKRSGSVFKCSLCPKTFNDNGAFYGHIQTKHNMQWREYKDRYGRCEVESAPFECKICGKVIKYDRNTIHTHLKNVHGINWSIYLDRIRKLRRGETPEELPQIEMTECRVCNASVKYLRDHLKNAHKITEQEYETLFKDEDFAKEFPGAVGAGSPAQREHVPTPPAPQQQASPPPQQSQQPEAQFVDQYKLPKPPKADIQNKANKSCSSCTITFDSRRSFIEHCTTVHNMKFKTKSGVTIAAPNHLIMKQQQLQQQQPPPLKRPSQPATSVLKSVLQTPPTKKPKMIQTPEGSFEIEFNQDVKPLPLNRNLNSNCYTPTGVSRWNQCIYQCVFCQRTTQSRSSMTSHIHSAHGIPIKDYKEQNYPDIEVETRWFQCRLCPTRTKFVKDCIQPHLKMSHSLDIEYYEQTYMHPEDWPTHPDYKNEPRIDAKTPMHQQQPLTAPAFSKPIQLPTQPLPQQSLEADDAENERTKWNKCRYKCHPCGHETIDHRQMRAHISTAHNLSYDSYVKKYGSAEVVTKKFRCEICNSEMKYCRQNIYAHMKDVHKITLNEYEVRYMNEGATDDPNMFVADGLAAYDNTPVDEPVEEPMVVNVNDIQTSNGNPDRLTSADRFTSKWNKCRFQCQICERVTSEKKLMRDHIMKAHGLTLDHYQSQYGDVEIVTEYFFCGICHAEVKHCHRNISIHLQKVHSMTTTEYEQRFGDQDEEMPIDPPVATQLEMDTDSNEFGFGQHFLTFDDSHDGAAPTPKVTKVPGPKPSREDVMNPKMKTCVPCDREFNRRQAFLEHCRNVHGMKIAFSKDLNSQNQQKGMSAAPSTGGPYPCDYCGKPYSNRSNKNRHIVLSCEIARQEREKKNGSGGIDTTPETMEANEIAPEAMEDPTASSEGESPEKKCPFPDCDVTNSNKTLMKRHLSEEHNILNVSVKLGSLDEEKKKVKSKGDVPKVPPLRVKLTGGVPKCDPEASPSMNDTTTSEEANTTQESSSDDAIEVPVQFEEEANGEGSKAAEAQEADEAADELSAAVAQTEENNEGSTE